MARSSDRKSAWRISTPGRRRARSSDARRGSVSMAMTGAPRSARSAVISPSPAPISIQGGESGLAEGLCRDGGAGPSSSRMRLRHVSLRRKCWPSGWRDMLAAAVREAAGFSGRIYPCQSRQCTVRRHASHCSDSSREMATNGARLAGLKQGGRIECDALAIPNARAPRACSSAG